MYCVAATLLKFHNSANQFQLSLRRVLGEKLFFFYDMSIGCRCLPTSTLIVLSLTTATTAPFTKIVLTSPSSSESLVNRGRFSFSSICTKACGRTSKIGDQFKLCKCISIITSLARRAAAFINSPQAEAESASLFLSYTKTAPITHLNISGKTVAIAVAVGGWTR